MITNHYLSKRESARENPTPRFNVIRQQNANTANRNDRNYDLTVFIHHIHSPSFAVELFLYLVAQREPLLNPFPVTRQRTNK